MNTVAPASPVKSTQPRHTIEDGLETYVFPSSLRPGREHDVYSADGAPWMVSPDMPIEMTIDETLAFISELQALRLFAQRLQDRRPLRRPAEVDEMLMERDQ